MRVITIESLLLWHHSASKAQGSGSTPRVLHGLDLSLVVSLMATCAITCSRVSASDPLEPGRACGPPVFLTAEGTTQACQAVC